MVAGEALGKIGSSGHSSGPHLHFEVYDAQKKHIDPFQVPGGCNTLNPTSWWAEQLPYHDPRVQRIMFSDAPVEESAVCGVQAITHERASFCPGETVYLYRFYTGIDAVEPVTVTLHDPANQTVYKAMNQLVIAKTQRWLGQYLLPPKSILGAWTLTITHQGLDYARSFTVDLDGCPPLPCESALDCPLGELCEGGICTPGECATDEDCGPDEFCDIESHTCAAAPGDTTTTTTDPEDPSSGTSNGDTGTSSDPSSGTEPGSASSSETTDTPSSTSTTGPVPPVPETTGTSTTSPDTPTDPGSTDNTTGQDVATSDDTPTSGIVSSSTGAGETRTDPAIDEGCNCSGEPRSPHPLLLLIPVVLCLGRPGQRDARHERNNASQGPRRRSVLL